MSTFLGKEVYDIQLTSGSTLLSTQPHVKLI